MSGNRVCGSLPNVHLHRCPLPCVRSSDYQKCTRFKKYIAASGGDAKCKVHVQVQGRHGAKVCSSPSARFPGQHRAAAVPSPGGGGGREEGQREGGREGDTRYPVAPIELRESRRIAALKAADCHDFTASVAL